MKNKRLLSIVISLVLAGFILPFTVFSQSINISENNGRYKIKVKNNGISFQLEYEGEITLSDDDTDIIAISDGGFFEVKKSAFGSKRKIFIDAEYGGQISKKYYVGRREKDYEPEGRKWLAEVLPEVLRNTRIAAESRVERIYRNGGVQAVINEIDNIESAYVSAYYISLLLNEDLSDQELADVIDMAGERLDSDHYLSGLLIDNRNQFLRNETTIDAYIKAAGNLDSDHYLSEVLRDAIDDGDINQDQIARLLDITQKIDSDHYISEVMRTLISNREINSHNLHKLLTLSNTVDSDHYKTEIIKEIMNSRGLIDEESLQSILEGMEDIDSDHYALEVIKEMYRQDLSDAMVAKVLMYSSNYIESDHYLSESLNTMIKKYDIGEEGMEAIIESLPEINSDHYATEVIRKLGKEDQLTETQLVKLLDYIGTIHSDHYLVEALKALSSRVSECGDGTHDAYRKAARNINSETYYGRALRAIEK